MRYIPDPALNRARPQVPSLLSNAHREEPAGVGSSLRGIFRDRMGPFSRVLDKTVLRGRGHSRSATTDTSGPTMWISRADTFLPSTSRFSPSTRRRVDPAPTQVLGDMLDGMYRRYTPNEPAQPVRTTTTRGRSTSHTRGPIDPGREREIWRWVEGTNVPPSARHARSQSEGPMGPTSFHPYYDPGQAYYPPQPTASNLPFHYYVPNHDRIMSDWETDDGPFFNAQPMPPRYHPEPPSAPPSAKLRRRRPGITFEMEDVIPPPSQRTAVPPQRGQPSLFIPRMTVSPRATAPPPSPVYRDRPPTTSRPPILSPDRPPTPPPKDARFRSRGRADPTARTARNVTPITPTTPMTPPITPATPSRHRRPSWDLVEFGVTAPHKGTAPLHRSNSETRRTKRWLTR